MSKSLFDGVPDLELTEPKESAAEAEARAVRLAFGTRPAKALKPAREDDLFDANPQGRLKL